MDLLETFRRLFDRPTPQAYTRQTHTPVSWQSPSDLFSSLPEWAKGIYIPHTNRIVVNSDQYPQTNPDLAGLSPVLRHEQIHALLPPSTIDAITSYLKANPTATQTGMGMMQGVTGGHSGTTVQDFATEAPAYGAQGWTFGLPGNAYQEFMNRMSPADRQIYMRLIAPPAPARTAGDQ